MVDVSGKAVTAREARAAADVIMSPDAFAAAAAGDLPKGDLLAVVRLAGVMAAKRTPELVPFCHPLHLTDVDVEAVLDPSLPGVRLRSTVRCVDRTGAEMEALTACAVAGLVAIDMVKAVDPWAQVSSVRVLAKSGGRRGKRRRPGGPA
jgi:cyclic pyranopterin phosphate synthase